MEHHRFCECFEIVVADTSLPIPQKDPLNILEPWKKVCLIDEDELVFLALNKNCSNLCNADPSPPLFFCKCRKMRPGISGLCLRVM